MHPLEPFDSPWQTRVVFGNNTVERLGELTRDLGGRRALLVTDPGVTAAPRLTVPATG